MVLVDALSSRARLFANQQAIIRGWTQDRHLEIGIRRGTDKPARHMPLPNTIKPAEQISSAQGNNQRERGTQQGKRDQSYEEEGYRGLKEGSFGIRFFV